MLEKLLLASCLTFTLNLSVGLNLSPSKQLFKEVNSRNSPVLILSQWHG
ncbi:hypothetical protein [Brunnivagina elsteri]|nr:hypothetical protein [Calothrix elsteri]